MEPHIRLLAWAPSAEQLLEGPVGDWSGEAASPPTPQALSSFLSVTTPKWNWKRFSSHLSPSSLEASCHLPPWWLWQPLASLPARLIPCPVWVPQAHHLLQALCKQVTGLVRHPKKLLFLRAPSWTCQCLCSCTARVRWVGLCGSRCWTCEFFAEHEALARSQCTRVKLVGWW